MNNNTIINSALSTIKQEIKGLNDLLEFFNNSEDCENFNKAVELIINSQKNANSRVIVSGMGKSGHIASKIAATLASTGTPAFFVHPAEASHGDLGMISKNDLVIILSNSGENKEIQDLIYYCSKFGIAIIGITRNKNSELAKLSTISLVLPSTAEANLLKAPTTSTTMMLALGDAIAVSLINEKNINIEDYRKFHPGGKLGIEMLNVSTVMRSGKDLPKVTKTANVTEVLLEISSKYLGCTAVVENNKLIGIITDGDIRRAIFKNQENNDLFSRNASFIMTNNPLTITKDLLAIEAVKIMNNNSVTCLFIVDDNEYLIGIIHLHDCLRLGLN
jgi:arabinose-5-phosphate isomerase